MLIPQCFSAIQQPFDSPLLFVAELSEESGDCFAVFKNRLLQAVDGSEQGRETCRQHWRLAHEFLDNSFMATNPRSQPSQVLQARFR